MLAEDAGGRVNCRIEQAARVKRGSRHVFVYPTYGASERVTELEDLEGKECTPEASEIQLGPKRRKEQH
jgi:hypothetical protein